MMAMEMKPEDRFQHVPEFRRALYTHVDTNKSKKSGFGKKSNLLRKLISAKFQKNKRRFRLKIFVATALLVLGGISIIYFSDFNNSESEASIEAKPIEEIPFDGMSEEEYKQKYPNLWREKYGPGTEYFKAQRTPEALEKRRAAQIEKAKKDREFQMEQARKEREAAIRRSQQHR
jgi:hypothetical protein